MTGPAIGQQLDATLADLKGYIKAEMKAYVAHDQLNIIIKAAVHELVQVINQNTENLRQYLNNEGIKIRTKVRSRGGYSAE